MLMSKRTAPTTQAVSLDKNGGTLSMIGVLEKLSASENCSIIWLHLMKIFLLGTLARYAANALLYNCLLQC